jgi:thiol-disulfide isomerase/thioredoxin
MNHLINYFGSEFSFFYLKVVIDFSASWCGPCKMMEPIIHAMANDFTDVEFIKIDVDELSVKLLFLFLI